MAMVMEEARKLIDSLSKDGYPDFVVRQELVGSEIKQGDYKVIGYNKESGRNMIIFSMPRIEFDKSGYDKLRDVAKELGLEMSPRSNSEVYLIRPFYYKEKKLSDTKTEYTPQSSQTIAKLNQNSIRIHLNVKNMGNLNAKNIGEIIEKVGSRVYGAKD